MSNIVSNLHNEHKNYARLLDLLDADVDSLEKGVAVDFTRLYDILNYMTAYPDISHHPNEEIIFSILVEKKPAFSKLTRDLTQEHHELAETVTLLRQKIQDVLGGADVTKEAIITRARKYSSLLRRHMNLEESRLFPAILNEFISADWDAVLMRSSLIEDPLFGHMVNKQFSNLFARISQ